MKRFLLIAVLILLGGAAAFAAWHFGLPDEPAPEPEAPPGMQALNERVPADTVFYFGGLEATPAAVQELIDFPILPDAEAGEDVFATLAEDPDTPPGVALITGIMSELDSVAMGEFPTALGMHADPATVFYAIGAAPVFSMDLEEPETFRELLRRVDERFELESDTAAIEGGPEYRRYRLTDDETFEGGADETNLYLGVAVHEGVATLFIDSESLGGPEVASLALGPDYPDDSLAESGRLESLRDHHELQDFGLGYLDFEKIVQGLVSEDANRFGRVLEDATELDPEFGQWLDELRTGECRDDLLGIAELWPGVSAGYSDYRENPAASVSMDFILDSRDETTMQGLQGLQGHLPEYLGAEHYEVLAGIGLGVDTDAVPRFLRESWQRFTQAEFQCPALQEQQQLVRQYNPALVGPAMATLETIQGVSAALLDIEPAPEFGPFGRPSLMASISAVNPSGLLTTIRATVPGMSDLDLPPDGTPVPLQLPGFWAELEPHAIRFDNHIIIYNDARGEALGREVGEEALRDDGFLRAGMHSRVYARYAEFFAGFEDELEVDEEHRQDMEAMRAAFEEMGESDLTTLYGLDFTDAGIRFRMQIHKGAEGPVE